MRSNRRPASAVVLAVSALLASELAGAQDVEAGARIQIGVTNHVYFSWVANLVDGLPVEVVPIVPQGTDLHSYQPRPGELAVLSELDALVANGLGHDTFVETMLEAAGRGDLVRVDLHQGVPLIPYHRAGESGHGGESPDASVSVNPHTFISLSSAVQQIYNLRRGLVALLPEHAAALRANARRYAAQLRKLKAGAARRLVGAPALKVATVHDGYAYLLQEFGIVITAVIQPQHGIEPSAQELASTIERIRSAGVDVVLSELDFPPRYIDVIRESTGVRLYHLSHVSRGEYRPDRFVREMERNLETLVRALVTDAGGARP